MKNNYFKMLTLFLALAFTSLSFGQPNAWINEIHYDNDGADIDESIEIVIEDPGSWDLSLLVVEKYNGNGGSTYGSNDVSTFTEGVTSGNFVIYSLVYPSNGLQNGAPDGVALSYNGTLIEFLSYEGTILGVGGSADGITSTDMGVSEASTSAAGNSLQLSGSGTTSSSFIWQPSATATLGQLNNSQNLAADTDAPVATWSPLDAATDIAINTTITITYDEAILNAAATEITDANVDALITLKETDASGADVTFDATIDADKKIITITPAADLSNNQVYYVAVAVVEDAAGNETTAENISFTTIDAATPTLEVTGPASGDKHYAGDNIDINWTSANITNVDISVVFEDKTSELLFDDTDATDGTELFTIPADAPYSTKYRVAITDASDISVTDTSDFFTIISIPTINAIQSENGGDTTNYFGDIVKTSGIVTYINGNNYYIASDSGAWNSINVYDGTNAGSLTVGDSIVVEAEASEYKAVTQLKNVTILSNNTPNTSISPTFISCDNFGESYESVLVKIINGQVTNADLGSNEFEITDATGTVAIDDYFYEHIATLNENLTITGIGYFSSGTYWVRMRDKYDVVSASDTVTSTAFTIDNSLNTITNIPFSISLANFKGEISACDSATYNVFDADGTTPATILDDTKKLIVVAADKITTRAYSITRNAALTDATVSSSAYTVDNSGNTITNIPFDETLAAFEANITAPTYGSFETFNSDGTTPATDIQTGYKVIGVAEDGSKKTYTITINTAPSDEDSYVEAPTTQIAASTVAIVDADKKSEAIKVFSFKVTDAGTADGKATELSSLVIQFGPEHTASFDTDIDSGYFEIAGTPIAFSSEPKVGSDSIAFTFASGEVVIPDGGSVELDAKLILQADAEEGKIIQLMIDADNHRFVAHNSFSRFASTFASDIVGNKITIDAVATELSFSAQPSNVYATYTISPAVTVEATDANGNIDTDFTGDISITAAGAILKHSEYTESASNGKASFDTLSFTTFGDGITLTAASTGLTNATSNTFNVLDPSSIEVYFSQYIEGGSNNKALEIYNPSASDINLDNYRIAQATNGGGWKYYHTFPSGAVLKAGHVWVMVTNETSTDLFDLDLADEVLSYPSVTHHNGDDARALEKTTDGGTTWEIVDIIGDPDLDPGDGWEVAGIATATKDHTLVRKVGLLAGNTDWIASAGTNETDSEWEVLDKDTFNNLGSPSGQSNDESEITEFTFPGITLSSTIFADKDSIACKVIFSADLANVEPEYSISRAASSAPVAGSTIDFSNLIDTIVVTAEDEVSITNWVITVEKAASASTENDILSLVFDDETKDAAINTTSHVIDVYLDYGIELNSLIPAIELSPGATSDPASGETVDFTADSTQITVTAEDGAIQIWKIVTHQAVIEVNTIAELRAGNKDGSTYKLTGEAIISFMQSYRNKKYVQDATGGIEIDDPDGVIASTFTQYDGITNLTGTISEYGGLMQLTPTVDPGTASSTGNTITPESVTVAELEANWEKYEAKLIEINSLSIIDGGDTLKNGKNYDAFDGGNDTLSVRIHFYDTDLTGTVAPDSANVVGIALEYNGSLQIAPRNSDDVEALIKVILSDVADLNFIKMDGETITDFSAIQLNYSVTLPFGTTDVPALTYELTSQDATAVYTAASSLPGTSTIVVTAQDGTTSKSYSVQFEVETTGTNSISLDAIKLYPSPVSSELTIVNISEAQSIQVIGITGKLMYEEITNGAESTQIDVSSMPDGLYILRVISNSQVYTKTFVKE